ncbi:MAG: nucleoside-diphosphate kinase [Thaumarchaeota archaeon]|nr:MAG: nucleoside-diphosphate kinase [Candidatus Wolframiiraptor sp.]RLG05918.1 MAG: nucleoside-diphosphate kinase [Nitrososphaerota archaeon]HDD40211.1 nucleoside-diphosphate kinase [Nitrososphaeria archaeon]
MERTFVMLKPSCVQRGLIGEVISRFEKKGLKIIQLKVEKISREKAAELYKVHYGKPFYENLINTIAGKTVVLMVLEGRKAISVVRKLIGATDPAEAEAGTIRGDLAIELTDNLIHASDSEESYEREHKIFFDEGELQTS